MRLLIATLVVFQGIYGEAIACVTTITVGTFLSCNTPPQTLKGLSIIRYVNREFRTAVQCSNELMKYTAPLVARKTFCENVG